MGYMEYTISEERLTPAAYIAFLAQSDLGSQYPAERFQERVARLVESVPISLTVRDPAGRLAGVCLGLTDFAYWLFLTDLGVVRDCAGRGIGRALVKRALAAGGEENIILYACAHPGALPFYRKIGMEPAQDVMVYDHIDWTPFTVT